MDDNEFDIELNNLLNNESAKDPSYPVSVEQERTVIMSAFYDHYVALSVSEEITTAEDLLAQIDSVSAEPDEEEEQLIKSELIVTLDELIQKDIEQHPLLMSGEMRVRGSGLYYSMSSEEGVDGYEATPDILLEGEAIVGDINFYTVEPLISYEDFVHIQQSQEEDLVFQGELPAMPSIMLYLGNAKVIEANTVNERHVGDIAIPLSYPSFTFEKIDRQSTTAIPQEKQPETVPVSTHFKSDFITEISEDIECDLNFNDYDTDEARAQREEHQAELNIYMALVKRDAAVRLSAFNAFMMNGEEMELAELNAYYLEAILMKVREKWRVAHAFLIETSEGNRVAHVLAEDIIDINYLNE